MLAKALTGSIEAGACPHVAVLLRHESELPGVLASFYALGASRRGWLVHRALAGRGRDDREMLIGAGLDVSSLEGGDQLVVAEFDMAERPEASTSEWEKGLEEALRRGFTGLWYSRFATGPDQGQYESVLAFERAWEAAFHDRPVVTLCPYVVGELDSAATLDRFDALSEIHDGVLVPASGGQELKLVRSA